MDGDLGAETPLQTETNNDSEEDSRAFTVKTQENAIEKSALPVEDSLFRCLAREAWQAIPDACDSSTEPESTINNGLKAAANARNDAE